MVSIADVAASGRQSAFETFGVEAGTLASMTVVLTLFAVVIAGVVAALFFFAMRAKEGALTHEGGMRLILWAGALGPAAILLALLVASLPTMRPLRAAPDDMVVDVTGEQFWWRVVYRPPGGAAVETANEVRVPVGRTVVFALQGGDVIHSFWIPGLAGKMDMIPGRTNRLVVRATRAGTFRGQCAEFCGLSHALMAFDVVAMEPAAFDAWLAREGAGYAGVPAQEAAPAMRGPDGRLRPVGTVTSQATTRDLWRGDSRHAGPVPASTVPQERRVEGVRPGGPRDESGVTQGDGAGVAPVRHAGLVPASNVPREQPAAGSRHVGPRLKAGVTEGVAAFSAYGCAGCHSIRGLTGAPAIGPDLTHVGARRSLGAGTRPMTRAELVRFIRNAPAVKPGARMPAYPQMPAKDAAAIARFLETLT
jgi:cytochrome c oxidase subunit II